jgi:hypothetical protein
MAHWKLPTWILLVAFSPTVANGQAEDLQPADRSIAEVVDFYVARNLQEVQLSSAKPATDSALLRRTTLDLVGRIPTVREAQAYVKNNATEKRAQMVDRLLTSPGYLQHQVNELGHLLSPGNATGLQKYLTYAIVNESTWDRIFRDLMLPPVKAEEGPAADHFLKSRIGDIDKLANDTSVLFFGVNISCAKCHDHPLVEQWKQSHFFGMKSFFSRTFANGDFLAERDYGAVQFKTTEGETKTAQLMFLSGQIVEEPSWKEPTDEEKKKLKQQLEELKKKKQPTPAPSFSRRSTLVDVALSTQEQDFFARNIVNRLWYRIFGHGLVMPLDQMHEGNPASHPELLRWLARDMVTHKYDLKRLLRGLLLSQAYARQSHWEQGARPDAEWFAVANTKPLSRYQYGHSLQLASMNPDQFDLADEKKLNEQLDRVHQANGFASQLDQPIHDFQVSTAEALLFSNSDRVSKELLQDTNSTLVGKLKSLESDSQRVELACWSILSRPPDDEERKILSAYLATRKDRPLEGIQQIVWALLTSTEFRFNH